jgi:hypothetical protein
MKKIALLCIAASFSCAALAQTTEKVDSVTIKASDSSINLPANGYKMRLDDFYQFKGSYELANGQVLSVFNQGRDMYAQVDGQERHQIVAANRNSFVSLDRQMKMRIVWNDLGNVSGEVYLRANMPANAQAGQGEQWMVFAFR